MGGDDLRRALDLPDDLLDALQEAEGAVQAFKEFPEDQAQDLADWIVATDDPQHREQRVQMVVELVVEHFAKLRRIDLTQEENRGVEDD